MNTPTSTDPSYPSKSIITSNPTDRSYHHRTKQQHQNTVITGKQHQEPTAIETNLKQTQMIHHDSNTTMDPKNQKNAMNHRPTPDKHSPKTSQRLQKLPKLTGQPATSQNLNKPDPRQHPD
ncbi:unnamed protein product [Amaranthus hypochondriacus]